MLQAGYPFIYILLSGGHGILEDYLEKIEAQGPKIHKDLRALFVFPDEISRETSSGISSEGRKKEGREMANVLFSDLLVPGWAETKIGLKDVTGTYGDRHAFALPCHNADPEIFFSEEKSVIEKAKSLCAPCPMREMCLKGALSRQEPYGVWGGELFHEGRVIAERRGVGRPRLVRVS